MACGIIVQLLLPVQPVSGMGMLYKNGLPRSKLTRYQNMTFLIFDASFGVLYSFIPIAQRIGIRSTYKFQCVSLLKFESHE